MHGWYAAARIAGTKGSHGKLRLTRASAFLRSATLGSEVAFVPPAEDVPRKASVQGIEAMGDDACLVEFDVDAGAAQGLVGCLVLLAGDAPAGTGEEAGLGWLRGFTLEDPLLGVVGVIQDVDDGPDRIQPLLQVQREGKEAPALVPLVDDLIVSMDEDAERLVMDLPAGILDL